MKEQPIIEGSELRIAPCRGYEASDAAWPVRYLTGVKGAEIDADFDIGRDRLWLIPEEPVVATLSLGGVEPEALELLFGQPIIALCDRPIPARGTE